MQLINDMQVQLFKFRVVSTCFEYKGTPVKAQVIQANNFIRECIYTYRWKSTLTAEGKLSLQDLQDLEFLKKKNYQILYFLVYKSTL